MVSFIVGTVNKILLKCISSYQPGVFLCILFDVVMNH